MRTEALRSVFAVLVLGAAVSACGGGGSAEGPITAPVYGAPTEVPSPNDTPSEPTPAPADPAPSDPVDEEPTPEPAPERDPEPQPEPEPEPVDRTATLTWDAPTTNADGSCLTDLASYRVNYGNSPGHYGQTVDIDVSEMVGSPTGRSNECGEILSYTFLVDNLDTASWYFTVQAIDTEGNASEYSNEVLKMIQ